MYSFDATNNHSTDIVFLPTSSMLVDSNMDINMNAHWYDKAKKIMKAKRIKQDELIDTFGVQTVGAVSHYLTGRRQPDPMQIKALADKLGCSVDELLSGGAPDPLQIKINRIIRAAEKAMATSTHNFTEAEKLSVYRAAFSAGLDLSVTDDQLDMLLYAFIKK